MTFSPFALAATFGMIGVASLAQTAAAQTAAVPTAPAPTASAPTASAQTVIVAPVALAPVPSDTIQAPSSGRCGLFETCPGTRIGLGKGDFIIRLSALGVMPEDRTSSLYLNGAPLGGRVKATRQAAPEFTFQYFFTDNVSIDLIAASTRHEIAAEGVPGLGKVDVASVWALPPTLTLAWHFRPHRRFNPYVGVGGTLAWFHNVSPANNGLTQKVNLGVTGGPSVNVGFDYQVVGNWFFNFDVKQIFMRVHAWAQNTGETLKITAHDSLDPTVVGAGIEYRF